MKDKNFNFDDNIQAHTNINVSDDSIWLPKWKYKKEQHIRTKQKYRDKIDVVEDYDLVEEVPDEEFRLRKKWPVTKHFKGRSSLGTKGEWDWLIQIAKDVIEEYGDKPVESKKIIPLVCGKYDIAHQTFSQRMRRCWRRGWIQRWQLHNKKGGTTGRHGKKLPHFWKFERIDDDKFGQPRIEY